MSRDAVIFSAAIPREERGVPANKAHVCCEAPTLGSQLCSHKSQYKQSGNLCRTLTCPLSAGILARCRIASVGSSKLNICGSLLGATADQRCFTFSIHCTMSHVRGSAHALDHTTLASLGLVIHLRQWQRQWWCRSWWCQRCRGGCQSWAAAQRQWCPGR